MPWYTSVEGDSMLSLPNGSLYLTEGREAFRLEYRAASGCPIHAWTINVPSLYEARRLSMDIVRNFLLSEVKYLETTSPTVGVSYACDSPTYSACGKVRVGCSACGSSGNNHCKCKRVYATVPLSVGGSYAQ
jgi:hypothetical protein